MDRFSLKLALALGLALIVGVGCSNERPDAPAPGPLTDGPGAAAPDQRPDTPKVPAPNHNIGYFETSPSGAIGYPVRVASGADGTVYLADIKSSRVLGYLGNRLITAIAGLDGPLGLAVHGDLLYVGNKGRGTVEVYNLATRRFSHSLGRGASAFSMPNAIDVASDGTVYVVDSRANTVEVFAPDGTQTATLRGGDADGGQLRFPSSIAVDDRHVVVGDQGNHRLQVFDRAGQWLRNIGGPIPQDISARGEFAGRFTRIQSVELHQDRIYVLDSYHSHVQVLTADGDSLGFIGRQGDCDTCMALALDLAVDGSGDLLVADPDNRRWIQLDGDSEAAP